MATDDDDEEILFLDDTPDDAIDDGDTEPDWSQVDRLQQQMQEIEDIERDDDRLTAAAEWAEQLEGKG